MQDLHVRDLLHKRTTSDRAASREEAKLAQLEVDSKTPLYDDCDPEVTRLSFTLELLKTEAKNKWTDKSLDEHLKYLHNKVLPVGNLSLLGKGLLVAHLFSLLMAHYRCATSITPLEFFTNGAPLVRH